MESFVDNYQLPLLHSEALTLKDEKKSIMKWLATKLNLVDAHHKQHHHSPKEIIPFPESMK